MRCDHPPILIAIGANLPCPDGAHPLATCRAAAEALRGLPGLRLHAISHWYASAPVPASAQPDFVNAAVLLQGRIDPLDLLDRLQAIEARAGRRRSVPNAARTLDLDIIAIGPIRLETPRLVLPHPRAHLRRFVLAPLCDLAPDWLHPALGRNAAALLAALPPATPDEVVRLA